MFHTAGRSWEVYTFSTRGEECGWFFVVNFWEIVTKVVIKLPGKNTKHKGVPPP